MTLPEPWDGGQCKDGELYLKSPSKKLAGGDLTDLPDKDSFGFHKENKLKVKKN